MEPLILADNVETPEGAGQSDPRDLLTAAKGGGVSFAGRLFEYMTRFVFGILIARFLGVEQFGLYTLGVTVASMASNFTWLGLQTGMVRFLPPTIRENDKQSIWEIIQICVGLPAIFSFLLGIGIFLFAEPLATGMFHDPRMAAVLRIVSILVPIETLAAMAYVITISFKQPKYSVIANNIITPLLKLLLGTALLVAGLSTQGVLIAQVIASVGGLVVMVHFVNTLFSLRRALGISGSYVGRLLRYSFPVYLGWVVTNLRSNFSTLLLGYLGLVAGVGQFTAASRFSTIGSMFYLSIGAISTPILADLHSQKKTALMKAYYQTTTRWLIIFNLPVFLTAILFARELLWIFGDDFTAGATSMMILAAGTLVYTGTGVGANILDMTDHPKVNTINSTLMIFVTTLLNVLLIPMWGVVGAAVASSFSTILLNSDLPGRGSGAAWHAAV